MPPNPSHYNSSYWRDIREQCLARDNYRCRLCNSPDALQAHHRTYAHFEKETLDDLTTLCEPCHNLVTDHQRRLRYAIRALPHLETTRVVVSLQTFSTYREVVLETNTV